MKRISHAKASFSGALHFFKICVNLLAPELFFLILAHSVYKK